MSSTTDVTPLGVRRRSLVRGAAWSLPVVALATPAPAFAASCEEGYQGTFDWGSTANYTPATSTAQTSTTGSMSFANGVTTAITVTSTVNGYTRDTTNAVPTATPNLGVSPTTVGGTGFKGLVICQSINAAGNLSNSTFNQTVKIGFGRTVYDVRISMTDLDGGANQYWDAVSVLTQATSAGASVNANYSGTPPTGSTVIGAGLLANPTTNANGPYRPTSSNTAFDNQTSNGGNLDLVIAGPIVSFSIVYWNRSTSISSGSSKQTVYLSTMTARTHNAGCAT